MNDITREQWIQEAYEALRDGHGDTEQTLAENERKNLRDWATAMTADYYDDPDSRITPAEAVQEEFTACGLDCQS